MSNNIQNSPTFTPPTCLRNYNSAASAAVLAVPAVEMINKGPVPMGFKNFATKFPVASLALFGTALLSDYAWKSAQNTKDNNKYYPMFLNDV